MAERIVDVLEVIEIEAEDDERFGVAQAGEVRLHPFMERGAVGQVGERVVARQMPHSFLAQQPFGDVLERRHEAAVGHRAVRDRQRGAVAQRRDGGAAERLGDELALGRLGGFRVLVDGLRHAHQLAHVHADGEPALRYLEYFRDALIEDDEPLLGVEHAQSLRHVAQRGVEPLVLRRKATLGFVERAERAIQQAQRQGPDGEIDDQPEQKAQHRDQAGPQQDLTQARRDGERADDVAAGRDRRAALQRRGSERRSPLPHRAPGAVVEILPDRRVAFAGQLQQLGRQLLLLPDIAARCEVEADRRGVQMRFKRQHPGRVAVADEEIAGWRRHGNQRRDRKAEGVDRLSHGTKLHHPISGTASIGASRPFGDRRGGKQKPVSAAARRTDGETNQNAAE